MKVSSSKVKDKMLGVVVTSEFHSEVKQVCKDKKIKMGSFLRSIIEKEVKKLKKT